MFVVGTTGQLQLFQRQIAAAADQGMRRHARHRGKSRLFVGKDVATVFAQELVASLTVNSHGDLIGHRPRRHKDRRLFAQQIGDSLLQLLHGGIHVDHVVTDQGFRHRPSHAGARNRDRVAAEIDRHGLHARVSSVSKPVLWHPWISRPAARR